MSEYLILIYEPASGQDITPEVWQQAMQAHGRFAEQVVEMGAKILGGNALEPVSTATSIRGDVVTDGPFVETKEVQVGGLDEVVAAQDLLDALLGQVDAARDPHRRGEDEAPLATVRVGDRGRDVGCRAHPPDVSRTGRTSTPPCGAGHSLATARAWSRSAASMR